MLPTVNGLKEALLDVKIVSEIYYLNLIFPEWLFISVYESNHIKSPFDEL
jgi:hypothetical protein